tara:strand:+ start:208 stop:435 length:228 start_codon:yes stop_codon:yes gene_type:complete
MSNLIDNLIHYQSELNQKKKNYDNFINIYKKKEKNSRVDELLRKLKEEIETCQSNINKYNNDYPMISKNTLKILE